MNVAWDVNRMSSFFFRAIGYLERHPELVVTERGYLLPLLSEERGQHRRRQAGSIRGDGAKCPGSSRPT